MGTAGTTAADAIDRGLARASGVLSIVGGVAVVLMMVHISVDVVLKYTLHLPMPGTIEIISFYYMPAAIFLPLAAVERGAHHIIVELFTQHLAPRRIAGYDAVACAFGVVYAAGLTWATGKMAVLQTSRAESWDATFFNLPIWPTRWLLPLGCGLLMLYMALHVYRNIRIARGLAPPRRRAESHAEGVAE